MKFLKGITALLALGLTSCIGRMVAMYGVPVQTLDVDADITVTDSGGAPISGLSIALVDSLTDEKYADGLTDAAGLYSVSTQLTVTALDSRTNVETYFELSITDTDGASNGGQFAALSLPWQNGSRTVVMTNQASPAPRRED